MNAFDVLASLAILGAVTAGLAALAGPPPRSCRPLSRGRDAAVLGLGVVSATSTIVHTPSLLRVPLVAVAVLLAPGFAIVVFRRLDDLIDEVTLALGLSFALLVLLGTLMVSIGFWQPVGLAALMGLITAPILTWQGVLGLRSSARSGADRANG